MMLEWTIVRFVPDLVAGEFINVGVVVMSEKRVHTTFIRNLQPVRAFGGDRADAYAEWLQEEGDHLSIDDVHWRIEHGNHLIQMAPLQPSMMQSPDGLRDRLAETFLVHRPEQGGIA